MVEPHLMTTQLIRPARLLRQLLSGPKRKSSQSLTSKPPYSPTPALMTTIDHHLESQTENFFTNTPFGRPLEIS